MFKEHTTCPATLGMYTAMTDAQEQKQAGYFPFACPPGPRFLEKKHGVSGDYCFLRSLLEKEED